MKISLLIRALLVLAASSVQAQTAPVRADVRSKSPAASDDQYGNPESKRYAGLDGYWDTGELRATSNAAR